jgi:hypothetical protein
MQTLTKHDGPWSFDHGMQHFFHKRRLKKEIEHEGIGVKLTFKAKHYLMSRQRFITFPNIKHQIL